jgi:hypothetical protein
LYIRYTEERQLIRIRHSAERAYILMVIRVK